MFFMTSCIWSLISPRSVLPWASHGWRRWRSHSCWLYRGWRVVRPACCGVRWSVALSRPHSASPETCGPRTTSPGYPHQSSVSRSNRPVLSPVIINGVIIFISHLLFNYDNTIYSYIVLISLNLKALYIIIKPSCSISCNYQPSQAIKGLIIFVSPLLFTCMYWNSLEYLCRLLITIYNITIQYKLSFLGLFTSISNESISIISNNINHIFRYQIYESHILLFC